MSRASGTERASRSSFGTTRVSLATTAPIGIWPISRDYVARRRPEIRIEEGRGPAKVFVPQHHPPGLEAEVDFGELWVRLAGVLVKCYHNDLDSRTSGRL